LNTTALADWPVEWWFW